jgi:hypothetical protein
MEKGIKKIALYVILLTLFITSSVLGNSAQAFEFRGFAEPDGKVPHRSQENHTNE